MAAFTRRQYAGAASPTTITAGINTTDTTCSLAATTGWPSSAGVPFYVVIDPGTSAEEKCSATISGSTLTLTRAQDDTTASSHSAGATIYPVFTANDADEANEVVAKLTTKGDLLVTTGSALNRLAVGSNDQVLVADSTATNGVKWATPAAAASTGLGYRSGKLYASLGRGSTGSSPTANTTYYIPFRVVETKTFDRISFVTGSSTITGTGTFRLGIYNQSAGVPTTVLLDAGTVNATAASTAYSATISQSLSAGVYYLAINMQTSWTAGSLPSVYSTLDKSFYMNNYIDSMFQEIPLAGYYQTGVTGAFSTAGTLVAEYSMPYMALRAA